MTDRTREEILAAATRIHDEQGCSCDRKYLMSCARMANAILASAETPQPTACCDSHNRHCESPGDLCCASCPEVAHDMFPTRHGDWSRCVLEEQ